MDHADALPSPARRGLAARLDALLRSGECFVRDARGGGMSAQALRDARILVVEDARAMRDALTYLLSRQGAHVRGAGSAAQAMTVFAEFRPELLVCDISMPIEDGY